MGTKTLVKQWTAYVKQLAQTNIKIPEMEELRPFMGKRGNVSKRQTRSKKQKEAFKKAAAGVKETLGRKHSAEAIKAAQKKAKFDQQKKTAGKNAATKDARKQHKKKPEEGKPLTKRAQKVAEEAEEKYSRMLDILTEGSQQLLSAKVRYEIYKQMDAEGFSEEDIKAFIAKLLETLQDIPEEAKELAKQDDYIQALIKLSEFSEAEKEDFNAMFYAMTGANADEQGDILEAIRYWEENNDGMSFAQFWDELEMYNDKGNPDNWKEILNNEED